MDKCKLCELEQDIVAYTFNRDGSYKWADGVCETCQIEIAGANQDRQDVEETNRSLLRSI